MLFETHPSALIGTVDPSLFQKDREQDFFSLIIDIAQTLERTSEIVHQYEGVDLQSQGAAIAEEYEDDEMYQTIVDGLGGDATLINNILARINNPTPLVEDEDYERAREERDAAATALINNLLGYQWNMRTNLIEIVGEDEESASEQAWTATWKKVHTILFAAEGTLLAEVTDFIDGRVRAEYPEDYRAMEQDRGPVVNRDVAARTFYIVMANHVNRAIIGANRDEWTGYQ